MVKVVEFRTDQFQVKALGFIGTGSQIIKRETPLGLYKGLGAVLTGIVPKMAIRFTSYEKYKQLLADSSGKVSGPATFFGTCFHCVGIFCQKTSEICSFSFKGCFFFRIKRVTRPHLQNSTDIVIRSFMLTALSFSRSCCRSYRGSGCSHANGGYQDSTPSSTPLDGRPTGRPKIPKRCTRSIHRG